MAEREFQNRMTQAQLTAHFMQTLPPDVVQHFKEVALPEPQTFFLYLARLYQSSDVDAQQRLVREDMGRAAAYLWAAKKLQGYVLPPEGLVAIARTISIRLSKYVTGPGGMVKKPVTLPELFKNIQPHLPLLADQDLPPNVENVLGDDIRKDETAARNGWEDIRQSIEQRLIEDGELQILQDTSCLKLMRLGSYKAARHNRQGLQLCTVQREDFFDFYNEKASLFLLVDKQSGKKYQFYFGPDERELIERRLVHFGSRGFQLRDEKDSPVSLKKLLAVPGMAEDGWCDILLAGVFEDSGRGHFLPSIPKEMLAKSIASGKLTEIGWAFAQNPNVCVRQAIVDYILPSISRMSAAQQDDCLALAYEMTYDPSFDVRCAVLDRFVPCVKRLPAAKRNLWGSYVFHRESNRGRHWRPDIPTEFDLILAAHPLCQDKKRPWKSLKNPPVSPTI